MPGSGNILILTSKTGGGHVSLAEALRDLFETQAREDKEKNAPHLENAETPSITIVDPQPRFFHLHYRLVSRYALRLWAAEFQFFDTPARALLAHRVFTHLVRRQLHTLLERVQPDLILTTYPFLSYEVMHLLKQRSSPIPLALFFSDANGVHAAWLTEQQAHAAFAPTRETYEQALASGFSPERLHFVGWPVRAQFARAYHAIQETRAEQLKRLKLAPSRFTIFLQGGGEGAAHVDRTIENVLGTRHLTGKVQVILAAGTNRALQERYQNTPDLAVLSYTNKIAPFMMAADVVMGKAGPNMLFEAVTLGKPFIASAYIPGQEEANLAFIQRYGLGWIATRAEEQRVLLGKLLHQPEQTRDISSAINTYRQRNNEGAQQIIPLICALTGKTTAR